MESRKTVVVEASGLRQARCLSLAAHKASLAPAKLSFIDKPARVPHVNIIRRAKGDVGPLAS